MQGLLSDSTHSYIIVTEASLARNHDPDTLVKRVESLRLLKDHIHSASLKRRQDIGPKGLKRTGYQRMHKFDVQVTDACYEYEGILEWYGPFDFSVLIAPEGWDFLPLYEAKLRSVQYPGLSVTSPAMLINRTHIATFIHSLRKEDD